MQTRTARKWLCHSESRCCVVVSVFRGPEGAASPDPSRAPLETRGKQGELEVRGFHHKRRIFFRGQSPI